MLYDIQGYNWSAVPEHKELQAIFVCLFSEKRLPFIPFRCSPFNCTLRESAGIKAAYLAILEMLKARVPWTPPLLMLHSPSRGSITTYPWFQLLSADHSQMYVFPLVSRLVDLISYLTYLRACLKGPRNLAYSKVNMWKWIEVNMNMITNSVILRSGPQMSCPGSQTSEDLLYHKQHLWDKPGHLCHLGSGPQFWHSTPWNPEHLLIINTLLAPGKCFCNLLLYILETKDDYTWSLWKAEVEPLLDSEAHTSGGWGEFNQQPN